MEDLRFLLPKGPRFDRIYARITRHDEEFEGLWALVLWPIRILVLLTTMGFFVSLLFYFMYFAVTQNPDYDNGDPNVSSIELEDDTTTHRVLGSMFLLMYCVSLPKSVSAVIGPPKKFRSIIWWQLTIASNGMLNWILLHTTMYKSGTVMGLLHGTAWLLLLFWPIPSSRWLGMLIIGGIGIVKSVVLGESFIEMASVVIFMALLTKTIQSRLRMILRESEVQVEVMAGMKAVFEDLVPPHVAAALMKGESVLPETSKSLVMLCSDLVGSTTLSRSLGPIKTHATLHRLQDALDSLSCLSHINSVKGVKRRVLEEANSARIEAVAFLATETNITHRVASSLPDDIRLRLKKAGTCLPLPGLKVSTSGDSMEVLYPTPRAERDETEGELRGPDSRPSSAATVSNMDMSLEKSQGGDCSPLLSSQTLPTLSEGRMFSPSSSMGCFPEVPSRSPLGRREIELGLTDRSGSLQVAKETPSVGGFVSSAISAPMGTPTLSHTTRVSNINPYDASESLVIPGSSEGQYAPPMIGTTTSKRVSASSSFHPPQHTSSSATLPAHSALVGFGPSPSISSFAHTHRVASFVNGPASVSGCIPEDAVIFERLASQALQEQHMIALNNGAAGWSKMDAESSLGVAGPADVVDAVKTGIMFCYTASQLSKKLQGSSISGYNSKSAEGGLVQIRIGVAANSATSGVLGNQLPAFTVFGPSLDISLKLEQTGLPDCVHMDAKTAAMFVQGAPELSSWMRSCDESCEFSHSPAPSSEFTSSPSVSSAVSPPVGCYYVSIKSSRIANDPVLSARVAYVLSKKGSASQQTSGIIAHVTKVRARRKHRKHQHNRADSLSIVTSGTSSTGGGGGKAYRLSGPDKGATSTNGTPIEMEAHLTSTVSSSNSHKSRRSNGSSVAGHAEILGISRNNGYLGDSMEPTAHSGSGTGSHTAFSHTRSSGTSGSNNTDSTKRIDGQTLSQKVAGGGILERLEVAYRAADSMPLWHPLRYWRLIRLPNPKYFAGVSPVLADRTITSLWFAAFVSVIVALAYLFLIATMIADNDVVVWHIVTRSLPVAICFYLYVRLNRQFKPDRAWVWLCVAFFISEHLGFFAKYAPSYLKENDDPAPGSELFLITSQGYLGVSTVSTRTCMKVFIVDAILASCISLFVVDYSGGFPDITAALQVRVAFVAATYLFERHRNRWRDVQELVKSRTMYLSLMLRRLLPPSVAERLMDDPSCFIADHFPEVTMMFMYVDFERWVDTVGPIKAMEYLDDLWVSVEDICGEHGCRIVEVIRGTVVIACGAPEPDIQHTANILSCATALRRQCFRLSSETSLDHSTGLKIGIHTGDVVCGPVGAKKRVYRFTGPVMATAARFAQSAESGKIHCSEEAVKFGRLSGFSFNKNPDKTLKGLGTVKSFNLGG